MKHGKQCPKQQLIEKETGNPFQDELITNTKRRNPFWDMEKPAKITIKMLDCSRCGVRVKENDLILEGDWPDSVGWICSGCAQLIYREYHRYCEDCGQEFRISVKGSSETLCSNCDNGVSRYTYLISSQNARARKIGLEANLTLSQWNKALRFFNGKCAYCQNQKACVIEHFVPVAKGGGTTAKNCVPACRQCNSIKGGKMPDNPTLSWWYTEDIKSRIRGYFSEFLTS